MKTQSKNKDEKIKCLNAIGVCGEDDSQQSFLEYTKYWMEKQNRGGLFLLKDDAYMYFRAVQQHCRKGFQKEKIETTTDTLDDRLPVLKAILRYNVAMEHWAQATAGQNQLVSNEVMQMCVKLWVNIRGHSFAASGLKISNMCKPLRRRKRSRCEKTFRILSYNIFTTSLT